MHLRFLLHFFLFLLIISPIQGETSVEIDSIKLNKASNKEKVKLSKEFVKKYGLTNTKSAIKIAKDRLEENNLSELDQIFFIQEQARSYYYSRDKNSYFEQITLATELLDGYDGKKDNYFFLLKYDNAIIRYLNNVTKNVDFSDTFAGYFEALEFAEKSKDAEAIAKVHRMIGYLYFQNEDFDKALSSYQKYLDIYASAFPEKKLTHEAWTSYTIAYIYLEKGDIDSALIHIENLDKKTNALERLILEAKIEGKNKNFVKSNTLLDAIINNKSNVAPRWKSQVNFEKGNNYFELRKFGLAEKHWQLAKEGFLESKDIRQLRKVTEKLYQYHVDNLNPKEALFYLEENKILNDSINKTNYILLQENEQKNKDLALSKKENAFLKDQAVVSQTTIRRQQIFAFISLIVLGIVLILLRKLIRLFNVRKKSNLELQKLHQSLELKNKENKVFKEKIAFWVQNVNHAIIGLDEQYNIIYHNQHFFKNIDDFEDKKGQNIFGLLGFPKEEQSNFLDTLAANEVIEFVWLNPKNEGVYKILVKKIVYENTNLNYGVIMRDLTTMKNNEIQQTNILQSDIDQKKKELATKVMQTMKRTSNLEGIITDLDELGKKANGKMQATLAKVANQMNNLLDIEDGWASFQTYFMEIHPSFLQKLDPDGQLTDNEIRHCCYIKLGLSNHEIATMLYVSPKSVEATHYRIKKKINLAKDSSLRQIIMSEHQ